MRKSLLIVLLFISNTSFAQNNRRDGNWWNQETKGEKLDYVTGFFDGMDLGNKFSYWGIEDKFGKESKCPGQAAAGYDDYGQKFFSNVTNSQLADGLDVFYKDYRNRSIRIHDAVWLVVNTIAGTPQEEVDKMIENWRKNTSNN